METNIIERAFKLAEQSMSVDEIRAKLKREGYTNVDAHFAGRKIRADLSKAIERNR